MQNCSTSLAELLTIVIKSGQNWYGILGALPLDGRNVN